MIPTAQHTVVSCTTLEDLFTLVSTFMRYKNSYMWKVKCKFLCYRYVELLMEFHN